MVSRRFGLRVVSGTVQELVLFFNRHERSFGKDAADEDRFRLRFGARRKRRGDAQVQRKRHMV